MISTKSDLVFDSQLESNFRRAQRRDPVRPSVRFNHCDPYQGVATDPVSLHKYVYGNGNPISNNDPSGMFSVGFDVAGAMSIGRMLDISGSSLARSFGMASGLSMRDIDPLSASMTDALTSFANWMNDRPAGAAEGWENWVPVYGSLKNAMAYIADGRWGWGGFYSALTLADAFLLGKLVTGIGGAAISGARALLNRAAAEAAAESFARRAGLRFVPSATLGGALGTTNAMTGEIMIADNLVGDALIETVRHELVHQWMTPANSIRATIRLVGYNKSHLLRFGEEFLAEFYGTGSVQRALGLALSPGYGISIARVAGEAGLYVATISVGAALGYNIGHGVSDDVLSWAGLGEQ